MTPAQRRESPLNRRRTSVMSSRRAGPSCAVLALFQVAVVCLLSSVPICSHVALAQVRKTVSSQKPGEQDIDPGDVISVNTTEVLLPVTVRDHTGQLVTDLTRKSFRVFEDGVEQPLSDLSLRQVPVDVVLMVDASSSVADNLDDFRSAAEGFAQYLAADDRISLIQFDDRVLLLQDWTKSRVQFRRSLRRLTPGMFTRFTDAIVRA